MYFGAFPIYVSLVVTIFFLFLYKVLIFLQIQVDVRESYGIIKEGGVGDYRMDNVIVMDQSNNVHYVEPCTVTGIDFEGTVEARIGKSLSRIPTNTRESVDVGICIDILCFILSLIGMRKTPVKVLRLTLYKKTNSMTLGETVFTTNDLRTVTIGINLCNVTGLVQCVGVMLHELSHMLSLPNRGHDLEHFYKNCICLYSIVYYKLPIYLINHYNSKFDFSSWNDTPISQFIS